jgi:hypothetical protein
LREAQAISGIRDQETKTAKHGHARKKYRPFASFAPFAVEIGFYLSPVSRLLIPDKPAERWGSLRSPPTYTAAGHGAPCPYENPTHLAIAVSLNPLRLYRFFPIGFHLIPDP